MRIRYDLHIHSCLSPCGDDELTPATVAGMAKLCGLDACALTDHNSAKNCPAFFKAAAFYGVAPLGGLELSTVEGVHVLCLFDTLEKTMDFDRFVYSRLLKTENRPDFFGEQLVRDEEDAILAREPYLLSGDTDIPFSEALGHAKRYGGVALPAHIDRQANGAVAVFGTVPPEGGFTSFELRDRDNLNAYKIYLPADDPVILFDSDAHRAEDIGAAGGTMHLPDGISPAEIPREILRTLL